MEVTGMSRQGRADALKNKVDTVDGVVTCDVPREGQPRSPVEPRC